MINDQQDQCESSIQKCANCVYFEERTCFCRLNPPQVVLNKDGYFVSCFPKISMPTLDFCYNFEDKKEQIIK